MRTYCQGVVDNAQSAAMQVKDLLGGAFNSLNDTLARALSGQKVSWASFFQGIAADLAKMALQNTEKTIAQGILSKLPKPDQGSGQPWDEKAPGGAGGIAGAIGSIFLSGAGKRDGSSQASALYVQIAGMGQNAGQFPGFHLGGRPGLGGNADLTDEDLDNLGDFDSSEMAQLAGDDSGNSTGGGFGAIGGFLNISSSVSGPRAVPSTPAPPTWWVRRDRSCGYHLLEGTTIPNDKLGGSGAMYYIDARGADADVEQRVRQSLVAVHGSSVRNSAAVQAEMAKRKPKGSL